MTEKSLPQPSSPHSPQMKGRTFTKYSLIWATAALVSLLYLFLLATQPDLVARYLGAGAQTAENDAIKKSIADNVAEVRNLRDSIDQFRSELIETRAQVANQSDVTRDLMTRVGTLEAEPAEPQKVAAADPAAKTKEAAAAKKTAKEAKKPATKKEDGLETGSVAQPAAGEAISFGPPTVTPATASPSAPPSNLVGVQIATGPSVDSLRLSWTLLNERHGTTMHSLQPRYKTEMAGGEQTYDLIVGPVASVDEARKLCQELAMKATPCTVARYTGDAL